ncbi:GroES-like protein [Dichomitus squalens]|uniref:GroES-like protein n=1 Tax=Dichomitus squalens TaxID=114155 RepID=A0A4Q9PQV9_9APHY|nr:GroES-like protein [Dichomitus squalens]
MSIPAQQKALVLEAKFGKFAVQTTDVPRPGPGDLLVKIEATALNPADWKIQTYGALINAYPAVLGTDGSGIVIAVGEKVSSEAFAVGDRVTFQGDIDMEKQTMRGTYAQYLTLPHEFVAKFPDNLSFDEAATVSSGIATAALPLYNHVEGADSVKLFPPWKEGGRGKYAGKSFLVVGGATSMGQFAIQFARLSGFSPIVATASLHHSAFLKTLGATHVVDRKLAAGELQAEFAKIASGQFDVVYDAVSVADTLHLSLAATAPGGHLVVVLSPAETAEEARKQGKNVHFAQGLFMHPINREVSGPLLSSLPKLLETGDIKPNRVEVLPGGLNGVVGGLERLKANQVSGVKLVVHPQETA